MTAESILSEVSERPKFIRTFDSSRPNKVGIIDDGNWAVGWRQPGGNIIWHIHEDCDSLVRQIRAVVQKKIGVAVEVDLVDVGQGDITLNEARGQLQIGGEVQKAQELSRKLTLVLSLYSSRKRSSLEIAETIDQIRGQYGRKVTNPNKISVIASASRAMATNTDKDLLEGANYVNNKIHAVIEEGISTVISLLDWERSIKVWTEAQDGKLERLRRMVGSYLVQRERGSFSKNTWFLLAGSIQKGVYSELAEIVGNPYGALIKRQEISVMSAIPSLINEERYEEILNILENSFRVLNNFINDNKK